MTTSDDDERPREIVAVLAAADDPSIEGSIVLPEAINDLIRSMIWASEGLNEIRLTYLRRRVSKSLGEEPEPFTDASKPEIRKPARYDGQISIRAREEDVARFQALADEREWSYGRMFHELLKSHEQSDEA